MQCGSDELAVVRFGLELKKIYLGFIVFEMTVGSQKALFHFDDVADDFEHDSLVDLVRLARISAEGGDQECHLLRQPGGYVRIQSTAQPGFARFSMDSLTHDDARISFEGIVSRDELASDLVKFCISIADHPAFTLMWISHIALSEEPLNGVLDQAEDEWKKMVETGQVVDDFDACEDFEVASIITQVPVPEDCMRIAEQQKQMLRSAADSMRTT